MLRGGDEGGTVADRVHARGLILHESRPCVCAVHDKQPVGRGVVYSLLGRGLWQAAAARLSGRRPPHLTIVTVVDRTPPPGGVGTGIRKCVLSLRLKSHGGGGAQVASRPVHGPLKRSSSSVRTPRAAQSQTESQPSLVLATGQTSDSVAFNSVTISSGFCGLCTSRRACCLHTHHRCTISTMCAAAVLGWLRLILVRYAAGGIACRRVTVRGRY